MVELFKKGSRIFMRHSSKIFGVLVCFLLFVGFRLRPYGLTRAERGAGYLLGIIGLFLMVLLLVYPLRKRYRIFSYIGGIKGWFRFHMLLGIVGPLCILYHANFSLGSLNSNVAMISMLIVSGSGIIGRFVYSQIHKGLYGERLNLIELRKEINEQKNLIPAQLVLIPGTAEVIMKIADNTLRPAASIVERMFGVLTIRYQTRIAYLNLAGMTKQYLMGYKKENHWSAKRCRQMQKQMERKFKKYLAQVVKVEQFGFYERFFALWHMLHIPLVYIMFLASVVHVVAVHLY